MISSLIASAPTRSGRQTSFPVPDRVAAWLLWIVLLLACPSSHAATETSPAPLRWTALGEHRSRALTVHPGGKAGFTSLPASLTSVWFTNTLSIERSLTNHILMNGSGVACGDVNGDGWCDVYLCNLDGDNALYLNQGGWRFTNITASAGVACAGLDCTGATFADVDGDRDLDLLVATLGQGVRLFLNDGQGHFRDATAESGLASNSGAMTLTLADTDGDGDLDLYVANYHTWTMRDRFNLRFKFAMVNGKKVLASVDGRPITEPDLVGRFTLTEGGGFVENGEEDAYYKNDGHGKFTRIPFTEGAFRDSQDRPLSQPPYDWGLSALFRDLNGDGLPDLYVCNDLQSPDRVWMNRGDGSFRALDTISLRKTSWFSMGIDVADINRDGVDDFVVVDMLSRDHVHRNNQDNTLQFDPQSFGTLQQRLQVPHTTMLLGRDSGRFSEIAWMSGIAATDWAWQPVFLDVDLDGYEDLLMTTGFERDVQDMDMAMEIESVRQSRRLPPQESLALRKRFPSLAQNNLAFRNRGDLTFEEVGTRWGFDLNGVSQGIALADLDNDGDLDVVLNNMNAQATLLRNDSSAPRVQVRLHGNGNNSQGIGARVRFNGRWMQQQEMVSGGRYLSGDEPVRTFAFLPGDTATNSTLQIRWRSGAVSTIAGIQADRAYEVQEPRGPATPPAEPATTKALFSDASDQMRHRHPEQEFDDYARQPLLPRKLSQLGPAACWFDWDGDGWEDLILGAGRGGAIAFFANNSGKGFKAPTRIGPESNQDDVVGLLALGEPNQPSTLLAALANYESPSASREAVAIHQNDAPLTGIPGIASESAGPMTLVDLDGDGVPELVVGGRVKAGRFPEACSTRIYRSSKSTWTLDERLSAPLKELGMASGLCAGDLNGDGRMDLLIAVDCGPVKVFLNQGGTLLEATTSLGLAKQIGWWNSVACGDFDNDGKLDFIAGNWGRNHPAAATGAWMLYGDLDGNDTFDVVEGYTEPSTGRHLPRLTFNVLGEALPFIRTRFAGYADYGRATIEQILGAEIKQARRVELNHFDTTLFLNRGDHFEARALSVEAQVAPTFGIAIADFNGDGDQDVFLAQNFFPVAPPGDRLDASYGLLMLGDGHGGLRPQTSRASGLILAGDQRAAAVCDYDHDGRPDLAVTQNASRTALFHNQSGAPCLRVLLRHVNTGRPAAGATLRAEYANGQLGPALSMELGSGYWSQHASTLLLGRRTEIKAVQIQWPGGRKTREAIPADAREISLNESGLIQPK